MTYSSYKHISKFASSTSFSEKVASLPRMASLLWYLTEDLNLLGLFDRNVSSTTKCAMVKVSENVKEDEPMSQARVDMTNTKIKILVECATKNTERLICPTNQLEILHKAASTVFSGCLSSTSIPLLLIQNQLHQLKFTLKHQALSCFERALHLLHESFNLITLCKISVISQ